MVQFEGRELFHYEPVESNNKKVDPVFRYSSVNNSKLVSADQVLAIYDLDAFPANEPVLSFPFSLEIDPAVKKPPSFNLVDQKVFQAGASDIEGSKCKCGLFVNWCAEAGVVGHLSLKVQYYVKVKLLGRPRRDA